MKEGRKEDEEKRTEEGGKAGRQEGRQEDERRWREEIRKAGIKADGK
jgi:hypothetical protein